MTAREKTTTNTDEERFTRHVERDVNAEEGNNDDGPRTTLTASTTRTMIAGRGRSGDKFAGGRWTLPRSNAKKMFITLSYEGSRE